MDAPKTKGVLKMKKIMMATINHSTRCGQRVGINLVRTGDWYEWIVSSTLESCGLPKRQTKRESVRDAMAAWGSECWDLKFKK